jgi:hypothetical protein
MPAVSSAAARHQPTIPKPEAQSRVTTGTQLFLDRMTAAPPLSAGVSAAPREVSRV